jgi:hypothetical protein
VLIRSELAGNLRIRHMLGENQEKVLCVRHEFADVKRPGIID